MFTKLLITCSNFLQNVIYFSILYQMVLDRFGQQFYMKKSLHFLLFRSFFGIEKKGENINSNFLPKLFSPSQS